MTWERISDFQYSLDRICLFCKYGHAIVDDPDPFYGIVCFAHSKRYAKSTKDRRGKAIPISDAPDCGSNDLMPLLWEGDTCDEFEPITLESPKTRLLDLIGMFEGTPWEGISDFGTPLDAPSGRKVRAIRK